MIMKRLFTLIIVVGVVISFTVSICSCSDGSVASGKWLDYGNGMINLNNCTYISPQIVPATNETQAKNLFKSGETLFLQFSLKFDNFTLTVEEKNVSSWDEYSNSKKSLFLRLQNIKDFLKSGESYREF